MKMIQLYLCHSSRLCKRGKVQDLLRIEKQREIWGSKRGCCGITLLQHNAKSHVPLFRYKLPWQDNGHSVQEKEKM